MDEIRILTVMDKTFHKLNYSTEIKRIGQLENNIFYS
jgi:hypothetical protein